MDYGAKHNEASLNAEFIANKKTQLLELAENSINVPEIIQCNPWALAIESLNDDLFPCLGRKYYHRKGRDILWLPDKERAIRKFNKLKTRDFLVRYIPKVREFRVHVLGKRWRSISEKANPEIAEELLNPNKRKELVWAFRFGWEHVLVPKTYPLRDEIGHIAVESAKILGFDFGAVDIILGEDNVLYVLEINAAPRLNERRIAMYADYFKREERKKREQ